MAAFVFPASAAVWNGVAPGATVAATFSGGDGTASSPYKIATPKDLAQLAANVNGGIDYYGVYFVLTSDIELNSTGDFSSWGTEPPANKWIPIGSSSSAPFRGHFDGASHTVSGLYISTYIPYAGLFGYVSAGTVKDVHMKNTYINGSDYVGGVVAYMTESVYFEKPSSLISGCTVEGYIHGSRYVGGIVGYTNVSVTKCASGADVSAERFAVGGIAGVSEGATVSFCSSTCRVSGPTALSGGIVGKSTGIVECCYNLGEVYAVSSAGGIAGYNGGTVTNCFNAGPVGVTDVIAGGIVGENDGTLTMSYSVGAMRGETDVFAVVGKRTSGSVSNCYYLSAYGLKDLGGCRGLNRSQMKSTTSFTALNFVSVWTGGSVRYAFPVLRGMDFNFTCPHVSTTVIETPCDCETDGSYKTVCTVCDTVLATQKIEGGHEYVLTNTVEPTCTERGSKSYTCTICEDSYTTPYGKILDHRIGPWVTTKAATCTEDGARYRTCLDCTYREDETLPAIGHAYEATVTEPDCLNGGYTTNVCRHCKDTYVSDEVAALGHTSSDVIVVVERSFTENGEYETHCTVCGTVLTHVVDPAYGFLCLGGAIVFLGLVTLILIIVCAVTGRKKERLAARLRALEAAPVEEEPAPASPYMTSHRDEFLSAPPIAEVEDDEDEETSALRNILFAELDEDDEEEGEDEYDEDDDWL